MEYSKILKLRKALFPKNLLMTYTKPVRFIKGEMQYLTSDEGYKYLDAYNNVPHVGHCHPRIAEVAYKQLSTLNTNTRYLHENMVNLGERLISMFPEKLKICTFVNSGSEANDLALRMARIHTQRRGILCMEYAYHGTLSSLLPISEYKYRKDPTYKEDNCYIASLPYTYQHPQRTNSYLLAEVQNLISSMNKNNHQIGAYIHESFPSCGGQIHLPEGYLEMMYGEVRKNGGVCIADDVQTGLGRLGECWWAFEQQKVVPDIVTLGKPMGNGFPMAAVICTEEIAESFNNGMEYFNTFAGSQLACATGLEVIQIIHDEKLKENALNTGNYMKSKLKELQQKYELIGDVRGDGFMLGVELVKDRKTKKDATVEAQFIIDEMKDNFVLVSTDGRGLNVIKVRPSMQFTKENADTLLFQFENALKKCQQINFDK